VCLKKVIKEERNPCNLIFSFSILNIPFMKTRYLKTFPYKFKETLWSLHVMTTESDYMADGFEEETRYLFIYLFI